MSENTVAQNAVRTNQATLATGIVRVGSIYLIYRLRRQSRLPKKRNRYRNRLMKSR